MKKKKIAADFSILCRYCGNDECRIAVDRISGN